MIDIVVLILLYLFVFYKRWKNNNLFVNTLMYIYLCFVLYFTLIPIITSIPFIFNHSLGTINLVPFDDYINQRGDTIRQIVLNIIMLIPFGFLIPFVTNKKFNMCLLYTFIFIFLIEFLQPILHGDRSFDITDIITNLIGGVIGYVFYLLFKRVIIKLKRT